MVDHSQTCALAFGNWSRCFFRASETEVFFLGFFGSFAWRALVDTNVETKLGRKPEPDNKHMQHCFSHEGGVDWTFCLVCVGGESRKIQTQRKPKLNSKRMHCWCENSWSAVLQCKMRIHTKVCQPCGPILSTSCGHLQWPTAVLYKHFIFLESTDHSENAEPWPYFFLTEAKSLQRSPSLISHSTAKPFRAKNILHLRYLCRVCWHCTWRGMCPAQLITCAAAPVSLASRGIPCTALWPRFGGSSSKGSSSQVSFVLHQGWIQVTETGRWLPAWSVICDIEPHWVRKQTNSFLFRSEQIDTPSRSRKKTGRNHLKGQGKLILQQRKSGDVGPHWTRCSKTNANSFLFPSETNWDHSGFPLSCSVGWKETKGKEIEGLGKSQFLCLLTAQLREIKGFAFEFASSRPVWMGLKPEANSFPRWALKETGKKSQNTKIIRSDFFVRKLKEWGQLSGDQTGFRIAKPDLNPLKSFSLFWRVWSIFEEWLLRHWGSHSGKPRSCRSVDYLQGRGFPCIDLQSSKDLLWSAYFHFQCEICFITTDCSPAWHCDHTIHTNVNLLCEFHL